MPIPQPAMGPFPPLTLNAIQLAQISAGGYRIVFTGFVPPGCQVYFNVGPTDNKLDITGGYKTTQLPALLELIANGKLWGQSVRCYVIMGSNNFLAQETKSAIQMMPCPVEPYVGNLGLEELGKVIPPFKYTGNGLGRMLHTALGGRYYFKHGGRFETSNSMRGFDCTTYVGSAYGLQQGMDAYGTKLADELGAQKCDMENKKEPEIKPFFTTHSGRYIMWSDSHVVMVVAGFVLEFSLSAAGYRKTDVQHWNFHGKHYWVRQL